MKRTVWLSFDIALGGDFDGMFEWLDEHEAEECGDNLAIVKIECKEADTIRVLKKSLTSQNLCLWASIANWKNITRHPT